MKRILVSLFVVASLGACATQNGFQQFYKPYSVASDALVTPNFFTGMPQVIGSSGDMRRDVEQMYENGCGLIGQSSFTGPLQSTESALNQAKAVGASYVVIASKYESTASGTLPITTPTTTTGYSYGTIGGYGYSGMTTTYGSQTTYMPYSVQRYAQSGLFFAPLSRTGLGIMVGDVPNELRQKIGTNQGVYVRAVRKGSPAFSADIIAGDVLMTIDGKPIFDPVQNNDAVRSAIGHQVDITYWRLGAVQTKAITIPATW